MNKYVRYSAISFMTSVFLIGCGGGGGSNTTIGTASYLDSAIKGVSYKCGSQEGITDENGTFKFESGKECNFYLGDIALRNISPSELHDGKKIIEDNATIASFLQTIDVDGNASNGIDVDKDVIATLKTEGITHIPENETQLTDVWSILKQKNSKYKGKLVDKISAMAHVEETKRKYLKQDKAEHLDHDSDDVIAWFGDKENNRIDVIDIKNMQILDEISTGHQKTYAAEVIKIHGNHTKTPKMYIDNRGSDAIDVLDSSTREIVKTIDLPFHPRSIAVNEDTGLVAVSGVDKPMTAIIDSKTDTLIATVGDNNVTYPVTSGHSYVSSGTLACGHPEWLDESHFVLLDRQNKQIKTYKIYKDSNNQWQTSLLNIVDTSSPVHNLIPPKIHGQVGHKIVQNSEPASRSLGNRSHQEEGKGRGNSHGEKDKKEKHIGKDRYSKVFYATAEGATDIYPSVLKLEFDETNGLQIVDELNITKEGLSANVMGVHHLNFMKDQKHIYVGSDEGNLFVVNYSQSPMVVEKVILAGKGAGHTAEFKYGNIAVVINHKDKFITLMNTSTNTKIADIDVSEVDDSLVGNVQTQAHPQYHFSKDGQYFYMFLTEEGALVKVSLEDKNVVERLDIGGKIAMGSFIKN